MTVSDEDVLEAFQFFLGRRPRDPLNPPQFVSVSQMTRHMLKSAEFRNSPQSRKTRHGWPLSQIMISHGARVIYCPIGKVACSFLKRQIVRMSNIAFKQQVIENVHALTDRVRTGIQLSDYSWDEVETFINDPEYFKFAVVRDPADRLLSAYTNKFVMKRGDEFSNIHHASTVVIPVQRSMGRETPDYDLGITFRQFISHITSVPPESLDPHWIPQHLYLQGIAYDRIFGLSQIEEVVDLLEARSGMALPRQPQNVTGSGIGEHLSGAADLLPAEIQALPRLDKASFLEDNLAATIADYFRTDYELMQQAQELEQAAVRSS